MDTTGNWVSLGDFIQDQVAAAEITQNMQKISGLNVSSISDITKIPFTTIVLIYK